MSRHHWIIRCFLAGLSISFACTSDVSYPEAIQEAERCIVEHPDSALTYLSSLDSAIQYEPEETRMYHALLTIKAKDKLYITHTSDSVIKKVVRFYESYGNSDKLMEAYHYMGSVYRDMNDAIQAVKSFQLAIEAGKESKRDDILARIYEQIGTLFAYQGIYNDAMVAYRAALQYCQQQEEKEGVAISLRNIARIYDVTDKQDSAICFYDSAYKKAAELKDIQIRNYIFSEVGCFYIDLNKIDLAKKILLEVISMGNNAPALSGLGRIYQKALQEDSAKYYFNEAIKTNNIYVKKSDYDTLSKIKATENDYPTALDYAYKSIELADSIEQITKTEAVSRVHSLYNYQQTEKKHKELIQENTRKKTLIYQLLLALFAIVPVAVWIIYNSKKKKETAIAQAKKLYQLKEEQYVNSLDYIEKNRQKATELEGVLHQAESQKDILQKQLIQSQKKLLEISNHNILVSRNEKDLLELSFKKSEIYQYFHEAQNNDSIKITMDKWNDLQTSIDTTYPNFTTRLYALYPELSELELHICYLIKISMQVKCIARIVDRSTSAITATRIRLYKKIHKTEGTAEMTDKFITDL